MAGHIHQLVVSEVGDELWNRLDLACIRESMSKRTFILIALREAIERSEAQQIRHDIGNRATRKQP